MDNEKEEQNTFPSAHKVRRARPLEHTSRHEVKGCGERKRPKEVGNGHWEGKTIDHIFGRYTYQSS